MCQGTRDKAVITHNEESRVHADTNAVQGETRDRALVTTVRGRHLFDTRHYGYQVEQFLSERERNCDESDENVSTIKTSQSGEYFCLFVWLDHVHNKTSCFSLQKKILKILDLYFPQVQAEKTRTKDLNGRLKIHRSNQKKKKEAMS